MSNPSLQKNDIKTLLDIIEVGKKFSDRTIFNAVTHFILMVCHHQFVSFTEDHKI